MYVPSGIRPQVQIAFQRPKASVTQWLNCRFNALVSMVHIEVLTISTCASFDNFIVSRAFPFPVPVCGLHLGLPEGKCCEPRDEVGT